MTSNNQDIKIRFSNHLSKFSQGLKDSLNDLLAVEINTMIVTEITASKFNPVLAYQNICNIPSTLEQFKQELQTETFYLLSCFKNQANPEDFKKYLELLKNNPLEQNLSQSEQDIKNMFEQMINHFIDLKRKLTMVFNIVKKNEQPEEMPLFSEASEEIYSLLEDGNFLRELRRISEMFGLFKGANCTNSSNIYDLVYAQTVISIDGDTVNRFHQYLFDPERVKENDKNLLLEIHHKAVESGANNWQELLLLLLNVVEKIAQTISNLANK